MIMYFRTQQSSVSHLQRITLLCLVLCPIVICDSFYTNEFAVHIPDGNAKADEIASNHGFKNKGQIGNLDGYYLFEHSHISKRSADPSSEHHGRLEDDPSVHWVEQQVEKKRVKRDFPTQQTFFPSFGFSPIQHHSQPRSFALPPVAFNDPLFNEQWYLNSGAFDGSDMNVKPAWKKGYSGKGVVVSILDDGIQTNHPDLAQNYDPNASLDINDEDQDPMPQDDGKNKHGTRCAGEVAAVANNGFCGTGVAYNASIGGIRMLDGSVNDAVEARALGFNSNHIDIYSSSWGPEDDGKTVDGPGPLARRALVAGVMRGRQGKGSIFIWASGNGGHRKDSCNCDGYINSIFTIAISSASQGGHKPWYLEECSSTIATTYSSGMTGREKAVTTTDMDGRFRSEHLCTTSHTGTSASAPLAAGILALALEANPTLTWRDVQYLIVMSSKPEPLLKEGGWIINGVNRYVSHKFGFGLMDAAAIVELAERWNQVPLQHVCPNLIDNNHKSIPAGYGDSLKVQVATDGCQNTLNEVRYLEHVQVKISLSFFPRGNLRILLTSPMNTTSTILFERPRDVISSNFDNWLFLSVHFWGEDPRGVWTMEIQNVGPARTVQPGLLTLWQLIFYGTSTYPVLLRPTKPNINFFADVTKAPLQSYFTRPADPFSSFLNFAGSQQIETYVTLDGKPVDKALANSVKTEPDQKADLCHAECHKCTGPEPTDCLECRNFRFKGECVAVCPYGYITGQKNTECVACHETCATCEGPEATECRECQAGYYRVPDLNLCSSHCPQGYYQDKASMRCESCKAHCQDCSNGSDTCSACDHSLYLHNNDCYVSCPSGTFALTEGRCETCHPSCQTCSGSSENQCTTCPSNTFYNGGSCISRCPRGYYKDTKNSQCRLCQKGCLVCSKDKCYMCFPGYKLNKSTYRCELSSDPCEEYPSACVNCNSSCITCFNNAYVTSNDCSSCKTGLLYHKHRCVETCPPGTHKNHDSCVACPPNCHTCEGDLCLKCLKDEYVIQNGTCQSGCDVGYYLDGNGRCQHCQLGCQACRGAKDCISCQEDWRYSKNQCVRDCPEGFYPEERSDKCLECHSSCKTCRGRGLHDCLSCPVGSMLDDGICIECQRHQFYDPKTRSCKECHVTCNQCRGPKKDHCIVCESPLQFDSIGRKCTACCNENDNLAEGTCCDCDERGTCRGKSNYRPRYANSLGLSEFPKGKVVTMALGACVGALVLYITIFGLLQYRSKHRQRWQKWSYDVLAPMEDHGETVRLTATQDEEDDDLTQRA